MESEAAGEGCLTAGRPGANLSPATSFLPDLWQEAEASGILCIESIPAQGRAFPAGDQRRKEPHMPWQEAVSSAGGMAQRLGRCQQLGDIG